jgi:hypothetical protein
VKAADRDGVTPFMRAANGNVELIRVLVAHGAALDRRDAGRHLTAEAFAELNGQPEAAKVLHDAGQNP